MDIKYLAIDSDVERANSEAALWVERGINMERVDSMTEGIEKVRSFGYIYVGINGDVIDYLPLLKTMRSTTDIPIFIATSNFTTQKEVDALNNGADLFTRWRESNENNIASVSAHITRKSESARPRQIVLIHKGLLMAPQQRAVFFKDIKIDLTRQEFDFLLCLMKNRGIVLLYDNIYRNVWNDEYNDSAYEVIKAAFKRLILFSNKTLAINSKKSYNNHGDGNGKI